MTTELIQELPAMISVARAAELMGMGKTQAYEAVKNGDIETITVNNRTWVLTRPLLLKLKLVDQ